MSMTLSTTGLRATSATDEIASLRALLTEARVRVEEVERENRDLRRRLGAARLAVSNTLSMLGHDGPAAVQRELMVEEVGRVA